MTNKERMAAREWYHFDEEMLQDLHRAQELLYEFNHSRPGEQEKRRELLDKLVHSDGSALFMPPLRCDYGCNIYLGKNFFANYGCTILDGAEVRIGDDVLFGPNVSLYTVSHELDSARRREGWEVARPITIGDNVWICGSVTIIGGVTIGANSVVAAGSVVTKDIPSGVLAAGNPAVVLRKLQ